MESAFLDLMPMGGEIGKVFEFVGIAEEEIEAARQRHPWEGDLLWDAFRYLDSRFLHRFRPSLYRAHCRELLDRVATGEDLEPGTDAELMAVLCETSQTASIVQDAAFLYAKLFRRWFPDDPHAPPEDAIRESYQGASQHVESKLREKLARDRDIRKNGR